MAWKLQKILIRNFDGQNQGALQEPENAVFRHHDQSRNPVLSITSGPRPELFPQVKRNRSDGWANHQQGYQN
jgi:hypothetical protein